MTVAKENKPTKVKYSYGAYNKVNKTEQWIRLTEGCLNQCEYCYEPKEYKIFGIPKIVRNKVKIMDMNLLCKDECRRIIDDLGEMKVNKKVVYYELICGIDYRFLDENIAHDLKLARFKNIRIAWDWSMKDQFKIKDAIKLLTDVGYKSKEITIFMISNWKTSYKENMRKLDLCKVWNVKVADCWFDNQTSPNIKSIHWSSDQIKAFRKRVRKHNQLVNFGVDPEWNKKK